MSVAGKNVKVTPPQQQQRDPFRNFFDRSPSEDFFGEGETEFVDIKEDAFLALTTNKDEVYVGEGFNTTLSFYVSQDNRAHLQFYELGRQLAEILKKIKPTNCWEENFSIENIDGESVRSTDAITPNIKYIKRHFFPSMPSP